MRLSVLLGLVMLLPVATIGCSGRYVEYHATTEIPMGPGLMSGEKGVFVLYDGGGAKDGITTEPSSPESPPAAPTVDGRAQEFEDFKRWKDANRDSSEYREFLEWQKWKAFRVWKEQTR